MPATAVSHTPCWFSGCSSKAVHSLCKQGKLWAPLLHQCAREQGVGIAGVPCFSSDRSIYVLCGRRSSSVKSDWSAAGCTPVWSRGREGGREKVRTADVLTLGTSTAEYLTDNHLES